MKCEECENLASQICLNCEESLCGLCDTKLHSGGNRKLHERKKICKRCEVASTGFCESCEEDICHFCLFFHMGHSVSSKKKTCAYWENVGLELKDCEKVLEKVLGFSPNLVKVYGEHWETRVKNMVNIQVPGEFLDILGGDLQNDSRFGVTQALIITDSQVNQVVFANPNIDYYHISPRTLKTRRIGPVYLLEAITKNFASGKILLKLENFLIKQSEKQEIPQSEVILQVEILLSQGKIILNNKEFGEYLLQSISVKVTQIDEKVFLAVLRSLKKDEIFPCEKAIQSRIREAFDLKFSNFQWISLLSHMKTLKSTSDFTFFSTSEIFKFQEIPYEEEKTYVIYPSDEQWASSDQFGDFFSVKKSQEYQEMLLFLSDFFTKGQKVNTLTGGKYGCALLLKYFSTKSLKSQSLGKIIYMVQIAINEDIIRYQKTLLLWSANYHTNLSEKTRKARLQTVKEEIIKLVKNKPAGVPLAQIPTNLKKKVKFQVKIPELGFKKLKDLLKTIPEIVLRPGQNKNPSAFFNSIPATIPEIQYKISEIMEKNTYCINEEKLLCDLFHKFGPIDWSIYTSKSLINFIDNYCKSIRVMKVGNENILIGRETEREELSISTYNSEYFLIADNEEKCNEYHLLDIELFDN